MAPPLFFLLPIYLNLSRRVEGYFEGFLKRYEYEMLHYSGAGSGGSEGNVPGTPYHYVNIAENIPSSMITHHEAYFVGAVLISCGRAIRFDKATRHDMPVSRVQISSAKLVKFPYSSLLQHFIPGTWFASWLVGCNVPHGRCILLRFQQRESVRQ